MNFSGVRVLCVGDVILDRFIYGEVERISPEAPVPVLRLRETRTMLGGAGNVVHNIAALGGEAVLLGLIGADDTGAHLTGLMESIPGLTSACVTSRLRPTIAKTRYIAAGQQVVRADEESNLRMAPEEDEALLAALEEAIEGAKAVILSDYGKGVLSAAVIARAIGLAHERRIAVLVDPKSHDFTAYRGATCITPNLRELAAAARLPVKTEAEVIAACRAVMVDAQSDAILATRSEKGMLLVEANGEVHSVPSRAREVFDVSGAGDTVIAVLALAHASGLTLPQAMRVSNAAAGVVVSKSGTATVELAELLHELDDDGESVARNPVRSDAEAGAVVERWKRQGLVVGFTNGCFDILHAGHVSLLAAARSKCDRLVVGINSDASVTRLKGATRPITRLEHRCAVMAAIKYVDCVTSFDEDTPLRLITHLVPDVLFKGADYRAEDVVGGDVVRHAGGRVLLLDLVAGQSTTGIVNRIKLI